MPQQVFVSYSHKDEIWRRRIKEALGSGVYATEFKLFTDDNIKAGAAWKSKINAAISSSSIALLLVSESFLQSDFIVKDELRKFLGRQRARAVKIFWVPIDDVEDRILRKIGLDLIQAAWPPKDPLSEMDPKKLKKALSAIGVKLMDELQGQSWDDLKQKVAETLGDANVILGKIIAEGDYSVFYRATQGDVAVAIKALVPAPGRDWLNKDFVQRANIVRKIPNSTAIKIRDVIDDDRTPCVVMDFVPAPTLASLLKHGEKLSPPTVAHIVAQLVRVAGQLHRSKGKPVLGPVRPSHVHYDRAIKKAFISLVPIASETLESCRHKPTRLLDSSGLPYLSPERYRGLTINGRVDQYHLGLLALELLGKRPAPIKTLADLQTKARFFQPPRSHFGSAFRLQEPAFSFVLARMLEPEPKNRWKNMSELFDALEEIAAKKVPAAVKQHASKEYDSTLKNNKEFFRSFYRILLKSAEVRALFERPQKLKKQSAEFNEAMINRQSAKLDKAMTNILNFTSSKYATSISRDVDRHRRLGIKRGHFGLFRNAFLKALVEAKITDEYSKDAWRAILDPPLNYMRVNIRKAAT